MLADKHYSRQYFNARVKFHLISITIAIIFQVILKIGKKKTLRVPKKPIEKTDTCTQNVFGYAYEYVFWFRRPRKCVLGGFGFKSKVLRF